MSGTLFTDTTLWCTSASINLDIGQWLVKLILSYDFIRRDISATNRAKLDAWFLGAGKYLEAQLHAVAAKRWPTRKSNDYTISPFELGSDAGNVYFGAMHNRAWMAPWANKAAIFARALTSIGIVLDNDALKAEAKRWFKEWVRYALCHKNCGQRTTNVEYSRCCSPGQSSKFPGLGFHYGSFVLMSTTWIAERFARTGDDELFDYATSEGYLPMGSEGGPKTLRGALQTNVDMGSNVLQRCGLQEGQYQASECNAHTRIDYHYPGDHVAGVSTSLGNVDWRSIEDTHALVVANVYYRSDALRAAYMRTAPGSEPYPATYQAGSWGGDNNSLPGHMFMFAQMEGRVWPYPNVTPP
jgi:hypothetical protein